MGKTSKWFRALLGSKKSSDSSPASAGSEFSRPTKEKKKWGFVRSSNGNDRNVGGSKGFYDEASSSVAYVEAIDANKHAIAVAAATAAVAEAALAAAQAAAEVVRLTSGSGSRPTTGYVSVSDRRPELAAAKIQSAFRAYLARRALRALKGLVKLQALVRGHIVRKQSADMLRRMQALARIQARACANRAVVSESPNCSSKSSQSRNPGLLTPKKYGNRHSAYGTKSDQSPILKNSQSNERMKGNVNLERTHLGSNWLDQWMEECSWNGRVGTWFRAAQVDDGRSDKILEVDTGKPHPNSNRSEKIIRTPQHSASCNYNDQDVSAFDFISRHSMKTHEQNPSISSVEAQSLRSLKFQAQIDENSPQMYSASSRPGSGGRRGPFTPARSECSRSGFSEYLGYPNYMTNTESSRAKVRSLSAPRQRMQVEKYGSTKRSVRGYWDSDTISEIGSTSHGNLNTTVYQGLGRFNRPGTPARCSSSYGGRC